MAETKRNPPWTRDELILLLELYHELEGGWPRVGDPRVAALSNLLNSFWRSQGFDGATLRNDNGIRMKLMNLRAHDPAYANRAGLKAGNRLELEVWKDFEEKPQYLKETAHAIRRAIEEKLLSSADQEHDGTVDFEEVEASEGRVLTMLHHGRERSRKIIQAKKKHVLAKTGRLACEACGFDFAERYGERGHGFIECHHIRPLSELPDETKTRLDDLALVCANCHRMIHAQRPWLDIDALARLLDRSDA
ncbi:HNH endonuclease [Novacetimonas cocois]|uniref:HNH endonuclease n=1 Tax=Novacetimonas cocois TaxID=1747507 RepID=UPI001980C600|nr:HNH endonuclease [Novacetimonas cocois]